MIWTHKYTGAGMTNEGCDFDRIVSIGVWGRNAKLDLLTSSGAPRRADFISVDLIFRATNHMG